MRFIDRAFGEITIRAETDREFQDFYTLHKSQCIAIEEQTNRVFYIIDGILVIVQESMKVIKERVESHLVGDRYVKKTVCSEE